MRFWIQEIRNFLRRIRDSRMDAYAAQSAFYLIMGFIPFVMLLLSLIQYTSVTERDVLDLLMKIFPNSFRHYLMNLVGQIYVKSTALVSGTALAAVWACSRAVLAISNGLNAVNQIRETRNYLFRRIQSAFYVVFLLLSLVLTMTLFVFGNALHDYLMQKITVLQKFSGLLISFRTAATLLILTVLLAAMYTFLPNKRLRFFSQLPGAAVAAMSWSLFSYGISFYFEWRGSFPVIYGGLTTVVMIMLWLYFCMWLIFFGALLNVYFEEIKS